MPVLTYSERMADTSPTTASFTNTNQTCSTLYNFHGPTFDALRASIVDLLGYTDTRTTDGRIRRTLPARHPVYPWLFADSCSPQGVGNTFTLVNPSPGPGSPIIPDALLYADYDMRVTFSARPYNSWQDKDISTPSSTYYDKDNNAVNYTYATEWYRFTTFDIYPANTFISAQQGQMVFRVSGASGALAPNGNQFQDSPRLYLPDSVLKVRWFQVPYRYLMSPNSYLTKFIGHINHYDFGMPQKNGALAPYKTGSLLYLGANPTQIYTPPIPDEGLLAFNFGDGFQRGRLCDLELNFLYTARTLGVPRTSMDPRGLGYLPAHDAAANDNTLRAQANRNWIMAGHNLLPWLTTRKFYYATTYDPVNPTDTSKWFPTYPSFPFELLFTDPDAPDSPVINP